jgi:hypothetical protein
MEVSSTIVSSLTILDLAQKINGLRVTVKNAEDDWKGYCDGLQAVGCVGASSPASESIVN